jgi:predicted nucleotidyltransferase component of viral defense system
MGLNLVRPQLSILPVSQRALWPDLASTPESFVLYGGTALALRLGHRQSEDFDFFSEEAFEPEDLLRQIEYLKSSTVLQSSRNTLTCRIEREGRINISFFGNLDLRRVRDPEISEDIRMRIASLEDLAGCKAAVVQKRADAKDYIDISAILESGMPLGLILAAGKAVYGSRFMPEITLRALTSFEDGNLRQLDSRIKDQLQKTVSNVDLKQLPMLPSFSGLGAGSP